MNGNAEPGTDFLDAAGGIERHLLRFDHTGSGDQEKRVVESHLKTAQFHVVRSSLNSTDATHPDIRLHAQRSPAIVPHAPSRLA
jgi:hypothetical protein